MRYYLVEDQQQILVELVQTTKINNDRYTFEFRRIDENQEVSHQLFHVRQTANKYYISEDGMRWRKMPKTRVPQTIVNVDKVYKLYRGYRPSGLSDAGAGALTTEMPGKVVKLKVKVGEQVEKGQTLLILEAMKMENEIKSAMDGVIKSIHVKQGQALDQGVLMMEIE